MLELSAPPNARLRWSSDASTGSEKEPICPMPNLSIKNVPDSVLAKLRERAARHHRSLQGELMALLAAATEAAEGAAGPELNMAPSLRRNGTRRIEEIATEHRRRWKRPFGQAPRAVDVVRGERDAR
jgi:plasmid stability protein